MPGRLVEKVYFITDPAFTLSVPRKTERNSVSFVKNFIATRLLPLAKRIQSEPNAVLVLARTVPESSSCLGRVDPKVLAENFDLSEPLQKKRMLSVVRELYGISGSRERKMLSIERNLELELRRLLKQRLFVVYNSFTPEPEAMALKQMRSAGFRLAKDIEVEGYGSWWEFCARKVPQDFKKYVEAEGVRVKRLRVPLSGSLGVKGTPLKKGVRKMVV